MKIFFLILGMLCSLTSKSYSNEKDTLENGKPLTPNERVTTPEQSTFPNWLQAADTSTIHPAEKSIEQSTRKKVFLTADHMTRDNKRDIISAWGKVIIRFDDRTLQADNVKLDNKTGDGEAVGHVLITQNDGTRIEAEKTLFNINNKQGEIFETRGRLGKRHYIRGEKITRHSASHYKIQKGHLTTCEGELPDWAFEAGSIDIVKGDRALFTKGVFKVKGVPIFYLPAGYIPINQDRKSGLLLPSFGSSSIDGVTFNNAYYWAINGHSDATFTLGYRSSRGFSPGIEYRYTPDATTAGTINASYVDDKLTRAKSWKVDASHEQTLPDEFEFKGVLDLEGEEFNRNFSDNTNARSRRNTDSFATIKKIWEHSSLDILTRYRDDEDQTFAELPRVTYKTQKQPIGETNFFFNQDSNFALFLTKDSSQGKDNKFSVGRFDFHPQITYAMKIFPWLSFTPTVGIRETVYSKGSDANKNFFARESLDITARLEGPRFEKVFTIRNNENVSKVKHLIEPRLVYRYAPDIDEKDRKRIKELDGIDATNQRGRQNQITYSLTHRLLQKELAKENNFSTREVLRFDISQTFDLTNDDKTDITDIRFDLDSRLHDNLELNFDGTFDVDDNVLQTFNFEAGIKPVDSLFLSFERRFMRTAGDDKKTFLISSVDWRLGKGWRIQGTVRFGETFDGKDETFREKNFSVLYENPCGCWGFNFDIIDRNDLSSESGDKRETKFLFGITLKGLGSFSAGSKKKLIHREFESIR